MENTPIPEHDLPEAPASEAVRAPASTSTGASSLSGTPIPPEDLPEISATTGTSNLSGTPIPPEDLPETAQPPQLSDLEAYQGADQGVIAGLEGLAKGIAGPLATAAETKLLGIAPEDIEARAAAHPFVSGAAEAAGLLGGAFIPGVGEYTLGAKVAQVANAAAATTKALELGRVSQAAIRLGIEGGLFKVSDNVSKMILGQTDPEEPVAAVIADVPESVLLGGGLGFIGGKVGNKLQQIAQSKGAKEVSQFMADLGNRFNFLTKHGDTLVNASDEAQHLFDTVQGAMQGGFALKRESVEKLTQNLDPTKVNNFVSEMYGKLSNVPPSMRNSELFQEALSNWQSKVFPTVDRATGASIAPKPSDVFEATDLLKRQLQEWASYDKRVHTLAEKPFINAAKSTAASLRESLESPQIWGEMGTFQKDLNKAYSEMQSPLNDFIKTVTTKVENQAVIDKDKLANIFRAVGKGKGALRADKVANFFDPAQKFLKTVDDLHLSLGLEGNLPKVSTATLDELLAKEVPKGAKFADWLHNNGPGAVAWAGGHALGTVTGATVGHPYLGYRAGEHLYPLLKEMGLKPTRWAVAGMLKALSTGEVEGIPQAINYARTIQKGADRIEESVNNLFAVGGKQYLQSKVTPEEKEKIKKHIESGAFQQQLQDQFKTPATVQGEEPKGFAHGGNVLAPEPHPLPQKPLAPVIPKKDPMAAMFPEQAMLVSAAQARVNGYLNNVRPSAYQIKMPFDKAMPDRAKEEDYEKAIEIAARPLSVLDKIKRGSLDVNDVKHVQNLYPELTNQLRKKMHEQVVKAQQENRSPPYRMRQSLSLFLGAPMDSSFLPQSIQAVQTIFAQQKSQKAAAGMAPAPKGKPEALKKAAENYQTPMQASEARKRQG